MTSTTGPGYNVGSYKTWFIGALIFVSALPAIASLGTYEVTNQKVGFLVWLFSTVVLLGGLHIWITIAYYFNPSWLKYFMQRPAIFFGAPAAIMAASIALVMQPVAAIGMGVVIGVTFVNFWHHGKQNWGVLSLVARSRGVNVEPLKKPLIYAWPFFIIPLLMYLPESQAAFGLQNLQIASYVTAGAYVALVAFFLWRQDIAWMKDPMVLALGLALLVYFMPWALLQKKPYVQIVTFGAHAMQYYLLVLATNALQQRKSMSPLRIVLMLLVCLWVIYVISYGGLWVAKHYVRDTNAWGNLWVRLTVGVVSGVNLIHFWVDAFIWRLSDKPTRVQHGDVFAFS